MSTWRLGDVNVPPGFTHPVDSRFEAPCSAASFTPASLPHVSSFGAKYLLIREDFRAENLKSSVPLKKNLRDEMSFNEVCHGRIICVGISPGKGMQ